MEGKIPLYILLFIICLLFSAFFSSSETAYISLQRIRLKHLSKKGVEGVKDVIEMTEKPEKLLTTILIGNNLVNTGAAALGTIIAVAMLGEEKGLLIATLSVTAIILAFGEIAPKILATKIGEKLSILYIKPIKFFLLLFYPFVYIFSKPGEILGRGSGRLTEEEVRTIISVGREEGAVEEKEAEMMEKVMEFGDRRVVEVMTPRTEIVWVEKGTSFDEFLKLYQKGFHSRFPVYDETVDNVVGVLWIKDILKAMGEGKLPDDITLLARPAYFVPESKQIGELFHEMQTRGETFAVVVDEYGGTSGIVTLEQLAEEIVGSLGDELSRKEVVQTIEGGAYEVDGGIRIEEVNEKLSLSIPPGDYETLAGFILHNLGRVPEEGESVRYGDFVFTIKKMRGVKIEKVLVRRDAKAEGNPY